MPAPTITTVGSPAEYESLGMKAAVVASPAVARNARRDMPVCRDPQRAPLGTSRSASSDRPCARARWASRNRLRRVRSSGVLAMQPPGAAFYSLVATVQLREHLQSAILQALGRAYTFDG